MSKPTKRETNDIRNKKSSEIAATPRSLAIFAGGIRTDKDFASGMSALMGDLIEGTITPAVGNAVCKAGTNLLNVIQLKYKYGSTSGENSRKEKTLMLTQDSV
jgi:hypothetical protein